MPDPQDQLSAAAGWLALSRQAGLTPTVLARLARRFGNAQAVFAASPEELLQASVTAAAVTQAREQIAQLHSQLVEFAQQGLAIIPWEAPAYPPMLLDLRVPPTVFFFSGELRAADSRALAIVGTRTASKAGLQVAREIAQRATAAGFCVVSGLARGIDTAAHQSTLLHGGRTLAVVGNGLLKMYPPENELLASRISRHGAVISELWPEATVSRPALLARDRLQAALSRATIVVQAHTGCGSLTTARYAVACRRPLFALDWQEEPFTIGLARLRQIGAQVITLDDLAEVFRAAETSPARRQTTLFPPRSDQL